MSAPTCTRCGVALRFDRRVGLHFDVAGGELSAYCWRESDHFPAWKHTARELTTRQLRALERAGRGPSSSSAPAAPADRGAFALADRAWARALERRRELEAAQDAGGGALERVDAG